MSCFLCIKTEEYDIERTHRFDEWLECHTQVLEIPRVSPTQGCHGLRRKKVLEFCFTLLERHVIE